MNDFTSHFCVPCDQNVLSYGDIFKEELVLRCLDCDALLEESAQQSFSPDELQKMGYHFGIKEETGKKGCRDGACGIRQP